MKLPETWADGMAATMAATMVDGMAATMAVARADRMDDWTVE